MTFPMDGSLLELEADFGMILHCKRLRAWTYQLRKKLTPGSSATSKARKRNEEALKDLTSALEEMMQVRRAAKKNGETRGEKSKIEIKDEKC